MPVNISEVLEQDPFLLMYELCGKRDIYKNFITKYASPVSSDENIPALSLQQCTPLSSNQWLTDEVRKMP